MTARMSVQHLGSMREIVKASIMDGGVLRSLKTIKVMDGGTLRKVASFIQPLVVSAGNTGNNPSWGETTRAAVANVTGGLAPFTYAWTILTGSATINSPTSASTTFTKPGFTDGEQITARVTVTDAQGSTAHDDITATWHTGGID